MVTAHNNSHAQSLVLWQLTKFFLIFVFSWRRKLVLQVRNCAWLRNVSGQLNKISSKMRFLSLIVSLFFFSAFSFYQEVPEDFSIVITENYSFDFDCYDSSENQYRYIGIDDSAEVKAELSSVEKEEIFELINEIDFFNLPNRFEPKKNKDGYFEVSGSPGSIVMISVKANGKSKTVIYSNAIGCKSQEFKVRTEKFKDLKRRIWAIIRNKEEVKNLIQSCTVKW